MENENAMHDLLKKHIYITGIKIELFLKNKKEVFLHDARMEEDCVVNNYFYDRKGDRILLSQIKSIQITA